MPGVLLSSRLWLYHFLAQLMQLTEHMWNLYTNGIRKSHHP